MQARVLELQAKEQQLRGRLEALGRLISLLASKVSEALGRYEAAQVGSRSTEEGRGERGTPAG